MTYQQTDARADRNIGCAQLQGLGRELAFINVRPRPGRLEWRVGKQAFERQNLCNSFNPCSEMLKILLLLFHFSVEVLIPTIKYWMVIRGIDVGRSAFKPLQTFSSCSLLSMCMTIDYLHHQWIYISKLAPSHPLTALFIHDCIFFACWDGFS